MVYYGITDRGVVRKNNQDVFLCEEIRLADAAVLVVCDGMGGAKSGNIASAMTAEVFRNTLVDNFDLFGDNKSLSEQITNAVEEANAQVYNRSVTDSDCTGMGTTIVSAVVTSNTAVIANVGDSRAYVISRTEGIRQVTRDHSVVAEMVYRGEITREQARKHPNKNLITRAIGTSPIVITDIFAVELKKGDRLLLCSDGLSNIVPEDRLAAECLKYEDPAECCEGLIKATIALGAPDNVTAALCII